MAAALPNSTARARCTGGSERAAHVVGDGARAEFLGATEPYDAVVLDLGLPALDGLTVLRRWRDAGAVAESSEVAGLFAGDAFGADTVLDFKLSVVEAGGALVDAFEVEPGDGG